MPVDERTFTAEVAGWVSELLTRRPDLPFSRASVEEHVAGTAQRHDFRLYRRHSDLPVLTGEIKMPDSAQGNHPLNADLVDDALGKASRAGIRYCFTWNVRQFVLFDSHIQGVPYAERHIEGPTDVIDATVSDDVERDWARAGIRSFWQGFLERFADLLAGRRAFEPSPIDQRFIGWLEGALEDPVSHTEDALAALSRTDSELDNRLASWMLSQGWEPSSQEERRRQNMGRASRLSCYILVTRLVFYQALRRRFRQMSALSIEGIDTSEQLRETLDARFEEAVRYSRDYETVFVPDETDLGYTIPFLSPTAPRDWARLVQRIEEFDFSSLDFDVIGQMYERLISPAERRRFGQFYTSPDVVDLINAFCIRNPGDRVLDPACGGGTFLVRAYSRKRALAQSPDDSPVSHESLLSEIFGIDIGAFPAQLSTINLAVRHLSDEANYPRVARASFFDAQAGIPLYDIPLTGDSVRSIALDQVNAVVGNPPYIRQEAINRVDKSNYRNLHEAEWPGQTALSGRSDIYAYFFSHAAHLLKPGGYLGFVTSIGWLDTEYGFRLQEFFLRNFRIVAVIESQVEKWFEDARVTTAVTILRREPDPAKRDANPVRFIQLRRPLAEIYSEALYHEGRSTGSLSLEGEGWGEGEYLPPSGDRGEATRQADMDAIRDLIEEIDTDLTTDYWRVQVRTQRELWEDGTSPSTLRDLQGRVGAGLAPAEGGWRSKPAPTKNHTSSPPTDPPPYTGGKWGQYVRGPDSWFELMDRARSHMTPLRELAEISRGFTSGADRFYCVRDVTQQRLDAIPDPQEFQDRWGISRKDTRRIRIVRDGANVEHLVEKRFLEPELHSLMEVKRAVVRKRDVARMVVNASVPRAKIRRTRFADYVAYAERQGWHTGSTVASRARTRPWYDLGLRPKSERSDLIWPKSQQYRHVVALNKDQLPVNSNLYDVWVNDHVQPDLLWAALNSTVAVLAKHQFGRAAGVEGNLKTEVVDVNMMLVPDIRKAPPDAAQRAVAACERMSRRNARRYLYEEFTLDDRHELDDATLEILGIEDPDERDALRDRLYRDVTEMQQSIRDREIIAQRDRRRSARRGASTPQDVADELWTEHQSSLDLLQFPEDFITRPPNSRNWGDPFDLPSGEVEVGLAMIDADGMLMAGTIRVGGRDGEIIDIGSVPQARFLEALSMCHREGQVRLPPDQVCDDAVNSFHQYRTELRDRITQLTHRRTTNRQRRTAITNALLRKALQWRRG